MSEPQKWQVLESHYVLDRQPYMTLREDKVALPNGAIIEDYFVFEYPSWVIVLALTPAREVVLIRQYRHGIGAVFFELAAGVPDAGENLLDCAQRELLEETGYGGGECNFGWRPRPTRLPIPIQGIFFWHEAYNRLPNKPLTSPKKLQCRCFPNWRFCGYCATTRYSRLCMLQLCGGILQNAPCKTGLYRHLNRFENRFLTHIQNTGSILPTHVDVGPSS